MKGYKLIIYDKNGQEKLLPGFIWLISDKSDPNLFEIRFKASEILKNKKEYINDINNAIKIRVLDHSDEPLFEYIGIFYINSFHMDLVQNNIAVFKIKGRETKLNGDFSQM